jgi:hypothetical protein
MENPLTIVKKDDRYDEYGSGMDLFVIGIGILATSWGENNQSITDQIGGVYHGKLYSS